MIIKGKAHVYGDNIDTDRIIAGKYTKTLNMESLAEHVMEDLDPEFRHIVQRGDIVVAGENFGCGSSREQAPLALKTAGISLIVAKSFARIFYRNAINIGLPIIEVKGHFIENGQQVEADLASGKVTSNSVSYTSTKLPQVMIDILENDGLVHYLKQYKTYYVDGLK